MGAETEVLGLREARAEAFVCLVSPCSPFLCVVVPQNEGRKLVPTCMGLNLSSLLLQEDLSGLKITPTATKTTQVPCPSGEESRSWSALCELRPREFSFSSCPLIHSLKH